MKKLLTLVASITAAAIGTAKAEVTASGSGTFYYATGGGSTAISVTGAEDSTVISGGSIAWAMSTETSNGITISGGASITRDTDNITTGGASAAAGGMKKITLAMDGMTVQLGDIDNAGSGAGDGGDVTTFASTYAGLFFTANTADAGDAANDGIGDGQGIHINTSLTDGVTLDLSFVPQVAEASSSMLTTATTTGQQSGMGVGISTTVSGVALDLGYATNTQTAANTENDTGLGASATYAVSDALSVTAGGYAGQLSDVDKDGMFITGTYTMDADTTVKVGYAAADSTTEANVVAKAVITSVNVSRSLGGGVSVFAEYATRSDDDTGVDTNGNATVVGTSVSF
jgi:hypothetical protein